MVIWWTYKHMEDTQDVEDKQSQDALGKLPKHLDFQQHLYHPCNSRFQNYLQDHHHFWKKKMINTNEIKLCMVVEVRRK